MEFPNNPLSVPSSLAQEQGRRTAMAEALRRWEYPVLLGCLLLAFSVFALAVCGSFHPRWLYRNPWIAFGWRFAAFYAVMAGIRLIYYGPSSQESSCKTAWTKWRNSFFVILIGVSVCSGLLIAVFQFMFGFAQTVSQNPLEIAIPFLAAFALNIFFSPRIGRTRFSWSHFGYTAIALLAILLLSSAVFLATPNSYEWYEKYLSHKYGISVTQSTRNDLKNADGLVPAEPRPPAGLVLRYLIYGERATDFGALND